MRRFIYVNGYGATHDLQDGNYARYLQEVTRHIHASPGQPCTVFLCGGKTNRTDLTEAKCMQHIWEYHGIPRDTTIELVESTTTARDNLQEVGRRVDDVPITVFCEFSRTLTMDFLTSQFFASYTIRGVPFDINSLTLRNLLKQRFLKLPLEVLACSSPLVDGLRTALREHHVAKARSQER